MGNIPKVATSFAPSGSSSLLVKPHKNNYFLDRNLILSDDLVLPNSRTASHSIDFHQK